MIWYTIILLSVLLFLFFKKKVNENFENEYSSYVITLKREDRLNNIDEQQKKISVPIKKFDAINGDILELNNVELEVRDGLNQNENQKRREIGCYLSHYNIYKIAKDTGYTIIFEDDFVISVDNLIDKIDESIKKLNKANIDFDIMFLGNHSWNENHGTLIVDNLYKVGKNEGLGGCHGYIINNKNKNKILKNLEIIDDTIDLKIQHVADEGKLNVVSTFPYYVDYNNSKSTIDETAINSM